MSKTSEWAGWLRLRVAEKRACSVALGHCEDLDAWRGVGRAHRVGRVCVSGTAAVLLAVARSGFGQRQERCRTDAAGPCWPGSSPLDSEPSTAGLLSPPPLPPMVSGPGGPQRKLWARMFLRAGRGMQAEGGAGQGEGYYGPAGVGMEGCTDAVKACCSAMRTRTNGR